MMNIYTDNVIINNNEGNFVDNIIITDGIPKLGLSYNELNNAISDGRDVIIRLHSGDSNVESFEVFRLDSYGFNGEKYYASFWGHCGHIEYVANTPDEAYEHYPM